MLRQVLEGLGLVVLLGLAFHAGSISTRVTKLEKFVDESLPHMFDDVKSGFDRIDKKLDRVVNMLFAHVSDQKTRITIQRENEHDAMDET